MEKQTPVIALDPEVRDQCVGRRIATVMDLTNQFALRRERPVVTQADLADVLGVSRPYMSQVIAGKRPLLREYLVPLARYLHVDTRAIAHESELPERKAPRTTGVAA